MHFKMAPDFRGRLDVAYVHLVLLSIIPRAVSFSPFPSLPTTKRGFWGEESQVSISLRSCPLPIIPLGLSLKKEKTPDRRLSEYSFVDYYR